VVEGAVFTPIWPPTGVAVACLLIFGLRVLPGIALGVLFVIMSITSLQPTVIVVLLVRPNGLFTRRQSAERV